MNTNERIRLVNVVVNHMGLVFNDQAHEMEVKAFFLRMEPCALIYPVVDDLMETKLTKGQIAVKLGVPYHTVDNAVRKFKKKNTKKETGEKEAS